MRHAQRRRIGDVGDVEGFVQDSEEHTSELQSRLQLVCRLLLEKKKGASPSDFTALTTPLSAHVGSAFSLSTPRSSRGGDDVSRLSVSPIASAVAYSCLSACQRF